MLNKYVLSRKRNAQFIRDNLETFIYQSMRLARYDVTPEECENNTLSLDSEEGIALRNFRNCYDFLLDTEHLEADYGYLLDVHWLLMDGLMDDINNALTEEQADYLKQMIDQYTKSNTEIAIDCMLYILNKRLFADGDVRAALMFANKIMLENGCGFITIPKNKDAEYRRLLEEAHHTENGEEFKKFIYTNCIRGLKNDNFY